jgi:ADP-ribose pyrophosphatase
MEDRPQVISSQERFKGRVFRVRTDEVRWNDGKTARLDIIEHPGSYAVIATPSDREIVLVRQYRHAIGRSIWEIPAGTAEPGESIIDGALRELAEETGYRAARARNLGTFFMTPGFCDEVLHVIHADQLTAGMQQLDDDERIDVQSFTIEEADGLVVSGEICDAKTLISLMWLRGSRAELATRRADN